MSFSLVYTLCCNLVLWLNLHAGVSQKTANIVLQALRLILLTTIQLISAALHSYGFDLPVPVIELPQDVRTVYARHINLEPKIIRTVCCPECFCLYPSNSVPERCTFKKSPRSRPCGAAPWTKCKTRNGIKPVPKSLYSTQSFESWLKFFLSRPKIEECLEKTFSQHQGRQDYGGDMHDVQDSPAWKSLDHFLHSKYNLIFAIYIDWFNPLTNKIAGMLLSFSCNLTLIL
jgi:hypothetical protein